MRYLLDTNAYIYWATDQDLLDVDVYDLLNEPDAVLCISAESVRELIVAYNAKGWGNKRWKTADILKKESHFNAAANRLYYACNNRKYDCNHNKMVMN